MSFLNQICRQKTNISLPDDCSLIISGYLLDYQKKRQVLNDLIRLDWGGARSCIFRSDKRGKEWGDIHEGRRLLSGLVWHKPLRDRDMITHIPGKVSDLSISIRRIEINHIYSDTYYIFGEKICFWDTPDLTL